MSLSDQPHAQHLHMKRLGISHPEESAEITWCSVHACSMHAVTTMCVKVGMRFVYIVTCSLVHSMHLTRKRKNRVLQMHIQASMQGTQKSYVLHLMVELDVGVKIARHPQHHLYHPDTFQGVHDLKITTLVAAQTSKCRTQPALLICNMRRQP